MLTNEAETEHDPFEEEVDTMVETEDQTSTEETKTESTDEEISNDEESGEEEQPATKEEKMIPESRLKAAIREATERAEKAEAELSKYNQQPVPDKDTDPDGYIRYVRLETSKAIMRQTHPDYSDKIKHFQKMATENPHLNQMVADHEMPAKFAYDLATRDLEIKELTEAKNSEEWKEFQEFKKNKKSATVADELSKPTQLPKNLNKATSANLNTKVTTNDDDYLWKGAKF